MTEIRQAIILAAGEGQRLRPLTSLRPKVMLPVAGRPILQYTVEALAKAGVRNLVIVVGYRREEIQNCFGSGSQFGVTIKYVGQGVQAGTGHALNQARELADERFLVLPGDNIVDTETVQPVLSGTGNIVLTKMQENVSKYGVVVSESGSVRDIIEKPETKVGYPANTGIYVLNRSIFPFLEEQTDLPQAIKTAIDQGIGFRSVETEATWLDAVYPWNILRLNEIMLARVSGVVGGTIEVGVVLKGKVSIGQGTTIRANSYIVGPAVIGNNCDIGPSSCIFPSTSIGDNVVISPFTQIRNSVLGDEVSVGVGSNIADSIISPGCSLGNNLSARCGTSTITIDNERHQVKMGAVIGDFCELEDNIVIQPGVFLGVSAKVKALKTIIENIPERGLVV